jgi:putative photosynthetic complex assembly protein
MSGLAAERVVPRAAIVGAGVLVLLTMVAAGTARWTGVGTTQLPPAAEAAAIALSFADRPDGAVEILAEGERTVLDPGTNGFIRGVLRGLARDRKMRGIGAETPFRLVRRVDGRLMLEDPATGRALDLGAFGTTNADAFARLMHPR